MLSTWLRRRVTFRVHNTRIRWDIYRQLQNLECVKKAAHQEVEGGFRVSYAVSQSTSHPHLPPPSSLLPRERPAAISIEIKSIDDTSNFDDFPESDILQPGLLSFSKLFFYIMLAWNHNNYTVSTISSHITASLCCHVG